MKKIILFCFLVIGIYFPLLSFASTGTIVDGYQQSTVKDQDLNGDGNPDVINWKPTNGIAVEVTDSVVTGTIWGETIGWVNLNPSQSGVTNNGSGVLGGYAWGQNAGWINFAPTQAGVTIDSEGYFQGNAWSQNYGWIHFECPGVDTNADADSFADTCVKTNWSPIITEDIPQCPSPPGAGPCIIDGKKTEKDVCSNIDGNQSTVPEGFILINGECIKPQVDLCPNNFGIQTTLPCPISPEPDLCPNDPGVQTTLPCPVQPPTDLCPNDPGIQTTLPCSIKNPTCEELGNCPPPPPKDICIGSECISPRNIFNQISQFKIPEMTGLLLSWKADLMDFMATLKGDIAVKTVGLVGVASAVISIPISMWRSILALLGYRGRKKWGVVYDSVTKQPLDPVYVVLQDVFGNEVTTSITDLDGRFGFLVGPGKYKIVANKNNYLFPSVKLAGRINDEVYQDLYFGEEITVTTEGEVILKNIPLDPTIDDWNERVKKEQGLMKFYSAHDIWFYRIATALFYAGFLVSIMALFVAQSALNIGIVALYVILFILRQTVLKPKAKGTITYKANGQFVAFPLVSVFSTTSNRLVTKKPADAHGNYYALVPKGNYYVTIDVKNIDGTYTKVFQSASMEVKGGIINRMFEI